MADDNNSAPLQPAPASSPPAAGEAALNGPAAAARTEGAPPSAPAEGIAPGAPPVSPGGEQVRAGEPPVAAAPQGTAEKGKETPGEIKDGFREVVETIVFVIVLVLMLKAFLAQAFVIPTGSMAPTLLGYHRNVVCPECGYPFTINMSPQLDPERDANEMVTGCTCPNCFNPFNLPGPR